MSERRITLSQRRSALLAHCVIQRAELARTANQIEARLEPIDRGIDAVRRYAASPLLIVAGVALLTFFGPKRLFRWASRGVVLITTARRVMRLVR